jgi:hypothetical protein
VAGKFVIQATEDDSVKGARQAQRKRIVDGGPARAVEEVSDHATVLVIRCKSGQETLVHR